MYSFCLFFKLYFCHCDVQCGFSFLCFLRFSINISTAYFFTPVYCVTSPKKGDRHREPPPTPPGYLGISLADLKEGPHPHLKPPDYSVAVQRSKMMLNSLSRLPPAPPSSHTSAWVPSKIGSQPQRHSLQPSHPKLADVADADSEADENEQVSAV